MAIRILHLSDFHWKPSSVYDQNLVISKIADDEFLHNYVGKIDFIVFSGDLVYSGDKQDEFLSAYTDLISPLQSKFGVADERVIVCPGNHDVAKSAIEETSDVGLRTVLSNTGALNSFIDRTIDVPYNKIDAQNRLSGFFDFSHNLLHANAAQRNAYFDVLKYNIDGKRIGFASFNTAWRSRGLGESERHTLLLGERSVDRALDQLKDVDFRIAVMHHPLDWLASFDQVSSETPLLSNFDVLMYGHVHLGRPSLSTTPLGKTILIQSGAIYARRDYFNGYALVEIDFTNDELNVYSRVWHDTNRHFNAANNVVPGGHMRFPLALVDSANRLPARTIQELRHAVRSRANRHVQTMIADDNVSFDKIYTDPPISRQSYQELSSLSPARYADSLIDIDDLLSIKNIAILGGKESGKSMISYKLALKTMDDGDRFRIPVFIDFNELKTERNISTLVSLVRRSNSRIDVDCDANFIVKNYSCMFIIDRFSFNDQPRIEWIRRHIGSDDKNSWIFLADESQALPDQSIFKRLSNNISCIYLLPLSRSNIRASVSKLPGLPSNGESVQDLIIKTISNNQLPRTHYIATLISLAIRTNKLAENVNEANLVQNFVDVVLKKYDPSGIFRGPTDFTGLNKVLMQLAVWMDASEGQIPEHDLLIKMSTYYKDRGIGAGAAAILDNFIRVGLCERISEDICFRFPAIQSFFLASHAFAEKSFVDKIFTDRNILEYSREMAFLSDLSRDDVSILERYENLTTKFRLQWTVNSMIDFTQVTENNFDDIIDSRLEQAMEKPRTQEEIDLAQDFSERAFNHAINKSEVKEGHTDTNGLDKGLDAIVYFQSFAGWGRAIAALDFLKLSKRKPSLKRLLIDWKQICGGLAVEASKFLSEIVEKGAVEGKPVTKNRNKRFNYFVKIQLPVAMCKGIFDVPGLASTGVLLSDTFDEYEAQDPEKLALAILLIQNRPPDWDRRIAKLIGEIHVDIKPPPIIHILFEALNAEYLSSRMATVERSRIEELTAELIVKCRKSEKKGAVLSALRQNRVKAETLLSNRI